MKPEFKFLKKFHFLFVLFGISVLFFSTAVLVPQHEFVKKRSETIYYGFFNTTSHDFFHYTSIIRHGLEQGGILFHNQFSDPWKQDVLFMPFYSIVGIVGRLFNNNPFELYYYTRNWASLLLVLAIACLVFITFKRNIERITALILAVTASSFWVMEQCGTIQCPVVIETYVRHHFNSYYRLLILAPHHSLAAVSLIASIWLISIYRRKIYWLIFYILTCVVMALLHPYFGLMWILIYCLFLAHTAFLDRKKLYDYIFILMVTCGSILPIEWITNKSYEVMTGFKFSYSPTGVFPLPFSDYLKATGFILLPFILSSFFIKKWQKNILLRLCFAWCIAPFVAFLTPVVNQAMSYYRLFQVMPQIPAAIFSVTFFSWLLNTYKKIGLIVVGCTLLFFTFNHVLFEYYQVPYLLSDNIPDYYNYQLFMGLKDVTAYLKNVTVPTDVVVAGERIAPMIPSLLNVHVINGHEGDTDNFEERVTNVRIFFYGGFNETEMKNFLKKYRARYIIYGYDSLPFDQNPYKGYSFLQEVYKKGSLSVVKVLNF